MFKNLPEMHMSYIWFSPRLTVLREFRVCITPVCILLLRTSSRGSSDSSQSGRSEGRHSGWLQMLEGPSKGPAALGLGPHLHRWLRPYSSGTREKAVVPGLQASVAAGLTRSAFLPDAGWPVFGGCNRQCASVKMREGVSTHLRGRWEAGPREEQRRLGGWSCWPCMWALQLAGRLISSLQRPQTGCTSQVPALPKDTEPRGPVA